MGRYDAAPQGAGGPDPMLEITPAMLLAGQREYWAVDHAGGDTSKQIVRSIYLAMSEARH